MSQRRAAQQARRRAREQRGRVLQRPSGLPRAPRAPVLLSTDPARNVGQAGIGRELHALPDAELIATLVDLGCPRWFADQVRTHPGVRFNAVATWCLLQDAREGCMVQNAQTGEWSSARDLIDAIREQYQQARKQELISDTPDHTVGLGDR